MAKRKLNRIREIEELVAQINFKDKAFKQAIRFELKQDEVDLNRLRHWTNSDGVEVYVETWNAYRDLLKEEGISSKLLIQSYHHVYQNNYNKRVFAFAINYINNRSKK